MAVRYEESKTPRGNALLKMYVSGTCDLADARTMLDYIDVGKRYHHGLVAVFVAAGTEYTPDARKFFPKTQGMHKAMASIVTSALVRAAINLMLRVSGGDRSFKMFSDEAAALTWLDAQA